MEGRKMEASERKGDTLSPIIEMFAFFAAMRNYSYLDILGNALERTTALEALGSALRDFRSTCLDASPQAREKLKEDKKVECPRIDLKALENSIDSFNRIMASKEEKGELVTFLREIYVKSLAMASKFKTASQGV